MFTHPQYRVPHVRVSEAAAFSWLWTQAPYYWRDKVDIVLREVTFDLLQPANTRKHWDVLAKWTRQIACRRRIPPIIVSKTGFGSYYIHDGNHRYEAIRTCFRGALKRLHLPVAVIEPKSGYRFEPLSFATHWTYILVPNRIGTGGLMMQAAVPSEGLVEVGT